MLLHWLLFGVALGVMATLFDHSPRNGGFFGHILLGVTGTLLALFLANLIFGTSPVISVTSVAIASYGAFMLLLTGRGLRRL